ncbi:hypothetical protein [Bacillus sp. V5-8f]|uniref:hypothetical protein n=1 Tax=Bacillus sp. V5-8f TaxID=2053044 RepID=UPI001158260A|nr:hypothetical protein [Bacillus sp. V5-8f]
MDVIRLAKGRREQAFLRKELFNNKHTDMCCICGKEYLIEFLVAAHIKKRADCSQDEKLDNKNIVMPMCAFGCDELYKKGFLSMIDGTVRALQDTRLLPSALQEYITKIEGRECVHYNRATEKYFKWHHNHHSK